MSSKLEGDSQTSVPMEYRAGSVTLIIALVLLGVILLWAGQLTIATANWDKTEEIRQAYKTSLILTGVGAMLSSVALIGGALSNPNLDKYVRLGMIVAAALIIQQIMTLSLYRYYP